MASLEPGIVVEGTVKKLLKTGAVIELDAGTRGLLHVSQISQAFVANVEDILSEGDRVCCVVIRLDPSDGSISLSTKMLEEKSGDMKNDAKAVFDAARARIAGSV